MLRVMNKVIKTTKVIKSVLNSKEFDNALNLASYKLDLIAKKEEKELFELKTAYKKEKTSITKLYGEQRKQAIQAFFSDFKAIYRDKELQQDFDCKDHVVTVFD